MFPRADIFEEVKCIPTIIAFKSTAVIWHEGVAGRKK